MRTIPAGEFKAKCLAIMEEVQTRGETVVITKRGKPVVRVTPLEDSATAIAAQDSIFGFMRGKGVIVGDIVTSEHTDEEWERMFEEKFADL